MGVRFRKSIKIAKGVRLNVSKSGVSATIGPRGASVTVGKNGVYGNVGIPGTGIYSLKKISAAPGVKSSGGSTQEGEYTAAELRAMQDLVDYAPELGPISVNISDAGEIIFVDEDGAIIEDKQLISLLKKHPMYKRNKGALESEASKTGREYAEKLQEETNAFINLFMHSPKVHSQHYYELAIESAKPEEYEVKTFCVPAPSQDDITKMLRAQAEGEVSSILPWKKKALVEEYVQNNFNATMNSETQKWLAMRRKFEESELKRKEEFDIQAAAEYRDKVFTLREAIVGSEVFVDEEIEAWLSGMEMPIEMSLSYEYDAETGRVAVDLDLPEIEDMPKQASVQLASGQFKKKDKTQKQLKEEYARCVQGLVIYIAACIFDISPAIGEITISGYTQRRNKAGDIQDDYIISVIFNRQDFMEAEYAAMNPEATILKFSNRMSITSSGAFKTIEPF